MVKANPKISVIVPVFNVEQYLPKCIDSIISQTFKDFELLLINDGSTDISGAICDRYATIDSRIKVTHQNNSGVSSARNKGLDKASGEFIIFVDSDDTVSTTYISNLIQNNTSYDLTISGIRKIFTKNNKKENYNLDTKLYCNKKLIGEVIPDLEYKLLLNGPTCKLFRRRIINNHNIRFDTNYSSGEDTIFVLEYIRYCTTLKIANNIDYNYYIRNIHSLSKIKYEYEIENKWAKHMYSKRNSIIKEFEIDNLKYTAYVNNLYKKYYLSSIYSMYSKNHYKNYRSRNSIIITEFKNLNSEFKIEYTLSETKRNLTIFLFKTKNPILFNIIHSVVFKIYNTIK